MSRIRLGRDRGSLPSILKANYKARGKMIGRRERAKIVRLACTDRSRTFTFQGEHGSLGGLHIESFSGQRG